MTEKEHRMLDLFEPEDVEVILTKEPTTPGHTHYSLLVNVNGICKLRIRRIEGDSFRLDVPKDLPYILGILAGEVK